MRKCPYCAEEIQDGAVICRYCRRRVRKSWVHIFVNILFLAVIVGLLIFVVGKAKELLGGVSSSFLEAGNMADRLKDLIAQLKELMGMLKNIPQ